MLGRKEPVCLAIIALSRVVFSFFYRIETEGEQYLPGDSAFILLPKHQRWQDIPVIALATPRPLYYIAKKELFGNRILSWFLRALGGIPLDRKHPLKSRDSLRAMIRFLEKGDGVVVFPEGTYYRNEMGPGKPGIVRLLASRLSYPLIPAGINYARRGVRVLARVRFGEPIQPEGKTTSEAILRVVMEEIAVLSGLGPGTHEKGRVL